VEIFLAARAVVALLGLIPGPAVVGPAAYSR
jgi:hypothetical protein